MTFAVRTECLIGHIQLLADEMESDDEERYGGEAIFHQRRTSCAIYGFQTTRRS